MARAPRFTKPSIERAYLAAVGAASVDECVANVVARVRVAMVGFERQRPVRLSHVARHFDIEPKPEYDPHLSDGELVYRESLGRFMIRLRGDYEPKGRPPAMLNGIEDFGYWEGVGRSRFTYAHEFCHRFFFERDGEGWRRILARIAEGSANEGERSQNWRALQSIEEQICNRAAGELLVPAQSLRELAASALGDGTAERVPDVCEVVRRIQREFGVSLKCAFVGMERAVRGQPDKDERLVAMLIERSVQKGGTKGAGSTGRGRLDYRVSSFLFPSMWGGARLKQMFPGIAVANLGPDLSELVERAARASPQALGKQPLALRLRMQRAKASDDKEYLVAGLKGWVTSLAWFQQPPAAARLMIWGRLD